MRQPVQAHHVGLTVGDLDRSRDWYAAAFGFEVQLAFELPGGARGAMLRTPGGAGLTLADPPSAMRVRGFGHVGLEVGDLDSAYATALAAGAAPVWEPRQSPEPGRRMAFIHDPDGNLVELISGPE
jgi:glyoxylase I family protein